MHPRFRRALAPLLPAAVLAAGACAPPRSVAAPAPVVRTAEAALAASLDSIFNDTAFARARWGVLVQAPGRGETLYARDAGKRLVPASNMKIVTGAAALEALGPDFRFRTVVGATGAVTDGVLRGDLVVVGGGDPAISERFARSPTAVFEAWADSLRARGIRQVQGRVVAVDDVFDDLPLGRGWAWDDVDATYSAEISGLPFNEGAIGVRAAGTRPGEPAVLGFVPLALADLPLVNRVVTGAPGTPTRLAFTRAEEGVGVTVAGTIAPDSVATEYVSVGDNTAFFARVLREALTRAGIAVTGPAVDADLLPADDAARTPRPFFVHQSPPLAEVLAGFMKPSQNQIGEILLKTLGRELRGVGTARAGIAAIDSMVGAWGLPRDALSQADGSGLSRYNQVAPELIAGVLLHMDRSAHRQVWRAALPVGGVDGTLSSRMRGTPLQGRVIAKTGTLNGVRALSGYLTTADGEPVIFSTIVNQHTLSARDADRVVDAALLRLAAWSRGAATR